MGVTHSFNEIATNFQLQIEHKYHNETVIDEGTVCRGVTVW